MSVGARLAGPLGAALVALAACGDGPTPPGGERCTARTALQPGQVASVAAAQADGCLDLQPGRYLVVPHYATDDAVPDRFRNGARFPFTISAPRLDGAATVAASGSLRAPVATPAPLGAQQRLDRALRLRERELARLPRDAASPPAGLPAPRTSVAQQVGSTRTFQVLTSLTGNDFATVTGTLRFAGTNVLVYVDQATPGGGLSAAELESLSRLFDEKLYGVAVDAFGGVSDLDRNGRVAVLLTPVVNRMTTAAECATSGFVTGFFYGLDLLPQRPNSNRGEVFYAMVADPLGATGSCAHSVSDVLRLVPATFIHELQHMISWNQHVIVRGSALDEELWLNEGLSHIAEELASLEYERDPSQPRSNPSQLFPDSSQGFVLGNYQNAFYYLSRPDGVSLTLANDGGSLEERGAAFLFLRWLGDQKGTEVYRRLVQTSLRGTANVEAAAGEPFERLFADFVVAAFAADRLPTAGAGAIPTRHRFVSRDLRQIFRRLYDTNTRGVTRPFPILTRSMPAGGEAASGSMVSGSMVPGTASWFDLTVPAGTRTSVDLRPAAGGGFDPQLGAQVSILRLP